MVVRILYYRTRATRSLTFDKQRDIGNQRTFGSLGSTTVTVDRNHQEMGENKSIESHTKTNNLLNGTCTNQKTNHSVPTRTLLESTNPETTRHEPDFTSKQNSVSLEVSVDEFASPRSSREHTLMGDLGTGESLTSRTIVGNLGEERVMRDNIRFGDVADERLSKEHAIMGDLGAGSGF